VFEVREPIYQETRDGTILTIVPDKKFRISCTNVGPDGRFTQYFSTEITPRPTRRKSPPPAPSFITRTSPR
jgi:UDP-3-O-[3-hydroxymyristoyl] N-acetylglucosamine deacetylase/3-hydroxyacyl-[acyl-carrier-protein] dehydratase